MGSLEARLRRFAGIQRVLHESRTRGPWTPTGEQAVDHRQHSLVVLTALLAPFHPSTAQQRFGQA